MSRNSLVKSITRLLVRAWTAFSEVAVVGFLAFLFLDRDNPFRSDDPYLVGLLFGAIAACLAFVYTVTETVAERLRRPGLTAPVYTGIVGAWCLSLWAGSWATREGADLLVFVATGSLIAGALTWILCRVTLPRAVAAPLSCIGALLVVMYFVVAVGMARR
jgi:hypothetical protein